MPTEPRPFDIPLRDEHLRDHCGVFGIIGHPDAGNMAYLGLYALQHRGQESAGIASCDGDILRLENGMGHVTAVFTPERIARLPGKSAIGHVRYSTSGESIGINAQPLRVDTRYGPIALGHNGNLVNALELKKQLEEEGALFSSTSDTEVVLHLITRSKQERVEDAIAEALSQIKGAFSMVFMMPGKIIGARDPHGFRPLVLGTLEDSLVLASETCALDLIRAKRVREVKPGEIIVLTETGIQSLSPFPKTDPAHCIFELVYFSRPDSMIFDRSVYNARMEMGRRMAREHPVEADVVVPVPDSGMVAALGYSEESGIPLAMGLIRNHYIGRTFIEPSQHIRHFGVRIKLNPVREVLDGKRAVMIDDSIVRGTTCRKILTMVREGGAKEVHMRISSPPYISPCYFGIDTPTEEELIANVHSVEEIRATIGADSLGYLSLEGLKAAAGKGEEFCDGCFTKKYPVTIPAALKPQPKLFDK